MSVDRCVCRDVLFSEVRALRDQGLTLRQIVDQTGCTSGCGSCGPYVRLTFKTGQTRFPVLSEMQVRRILAELPIDGSGSDGISGDKVK